MLLKLLIRVFMFRGASELVATNRARRWQGRILMGAGVVAMVALLVVMARANLNLRSEAKALRIERDDARTELTIMRDHLARAEKAAVAARQRADQIQQRSDAATAELRHIGGEDDATRAFLDSPLPLPVRCFRERLYEQAPSADCVPSTAD